MDVAQDHYGSVINGAYSLVRSPYSQELRPVTVTIYYAGVWKNGEDIREGRYPLLLPCSQGSLRLAVQITPPIILHEMDELERRFPVTFCTQGLVACIRDGGICLKAMVFVRTMYE